MSGVLVTRIRAACAAFTVVMVPATLLLVLVLPGYLAWRQQVKDDRAAVLEIRQNRQETIENRKVGERIERMLREILCRLPATQPATQPATRPAEAP